MFVRPWLRFGDRSCVFQALVVFFRPELCDTNLKFMRRVSEKERAIRQFVIVKNKVTSVLNASVLLLTMNFVITLSK